MTLKIFIPKETAKEELRVSASPETVKKLVALGCAVDVQASAGEGASFSDAAYKDAGAKVIKTASSGFKNADIVLGVQSPSNKDAKDIKKGALLIATLSPFQNEKLLSELCTQGVTTVAMEMVPRITRAQSMDVLSSQANLMGYKSVLDACEHYGRAFPMMMTAAGTVPPAKVFVMGAGVAGLQAVATAKRLGAVVSATDVRPAAKEQVQSLGGTFIAIEDEEFKEAETAGGYAKEMSAEYKKKQAALVAETIAKQDIIITTALIPGRPAPKLVSADMVKSMKPGSVIVDLAAPTGGNCELTNPGKVDVKHGVTIVGYNNVPSRLAESTSSLYARNILSLLNLLIDKDSVSVNLDFGDEIIKGVVITHDGDVVHDNFKDMIKASVPKKVATKKPTTKKSTAKKSDKGE